MVRSNKKQLNLKHYFGFTTVRSELFCGCRIFCYDGIRVDFNLAERWQRLADVVELVKARGEGVGQIEVEL